MTRSISVIARACSPARCSVNAALKASAASSGCPASARSKAADRRAELAVLRVQVAEHVPRLVARRVERDDLLQHGQGLPVGAEEKQRLRPPYRSDSRENGLISASPLALDERAAVVAAGGAHRRSAHSTIASHTTRPAPRDERMWLSSTMRGVSQRAARSNGYGDDAEHLVEQVALALATREH
jgi:hypothetical protein